MTANMVDQALVRAPAEVGPALFRLREDQWFDRKSIRIAPKDLAQHIVALANAEGGTLVLGLHDGVVEGVRATPEKINDFQQTSIDHTVPPARVKVEQVKCINSAGKLDTLIVLRVQPGEVVHELKNGDCYLRVGDESRKLRHEQRRELEFDRGQSQFDGHPVAGTTLDNLDPVGVKAYHEATGSIRTAKELFKNRGLLTHDGTVTNAGYLLFAESPQDTFPQAYVRVIKFLTDERGTGARLNVEEGKDIRIEGPIAEVIHNADLAISSFIPKRRALRESGLFEAQPVVPREAWLEGLVNAVIHRSYSLAGDHIRVEIYQTRVEIVSPGRFPGLADPRHPLEISRYARNPRIAKVCADLRIGQELGEGIKRIFDEMRRVGFTDPIYQQEQGAVRLTLEAMQRLDPLQLAKLPRDSQRVLDILRANGGPMGTGEIAEAMDLSSPAAKKRLDALLGLGFVRWIGKSKRDPRAVWELTNQ
ncbi:ATP-binding protein [Arthrobacter sp. HLT1-20]